MIILLFAPVPPLSTASNKQVTLSRVMFALFRIKNFQKLIYKGPKYRKLKSFSWKQNSPLLMDSVEDYVRRWAKEEKVEVYTLLSGPN